MAGKTTEFRGFAELGASLRGVAAAAQQAIVEDVVLDAGLAYEAMVKLKTSSWVDTGAYRSSITTELRESRDGYAEAGTGTDRRDAFAHEFGSGLQAESGERAKYPIEPDKKKMLAFFWPDAPAELPRLADGRVLLPRVMHPGIKATPHFRPALAQGKDKLVAYMGDRLARKIVEQADKSRGSGGRS